MTEVTDKSVLLIISGGIAAYKSLELIRLIKKGGGSVRCILTKGGEQFVTPLSVSALCEEQAYTDLWSLKDETEMGHIRLSREADVIIIAPASANLIAQMAQGRADDLASTALLASDKPALIAPAMNVRMWENPATKANIEKLKEYGHTIIGPTEGDMACGEYGMGRMLEPEEIFVAITGALEQPLPKKKLTGKTALVTSGPTYEAIDPVRFIGNRSSGKQGHAIATALQQAGADVTLVTGPVNIPDPAGVKTIHIQTAAEMLKACEDTLPADIAVCAAAVSDWAPKQHEQKIKKRGDSSAPNIELSENPDILKTISNHKNRPEIVIGFAAETENLEENGQAKLAKKGCDIILANLVAQDGAEVFGTDQNQVSCITASAVDNWAPMTKSAIAKKLTDTIINALNQTETLKSAAE
ncbi:MAG: bifunctional phosphopantothenoylcysteine decarboxylase/phosphopantothenate--cysteine ligase CoaBC [Alphaproteobacteria bacterium]|nr:bifunctional phosphopantothenoylcysteine decarboxylase/phosphopantothenate--cysteine ligase CoaBC [Alphaproteobacteria bacterium]